MQESDRLSSRNRPQSDSTTHNSVLPLMLWLNGFSSDETAYSQIFDLHVFRNSRHPKDSR
ncbi:hypothetical protein RB5831 [Rhodopirellula baltica SH 1]|uniref:Uncharacterized protein n=1 Tax=Rhodopirellula baltica (strain DSM 10527 / NCIMB 13988 / SH1) TaxID=243090 RepID=Q7UR81_RHOBA|nr:hypothetical protein RB5831 [Rhodopirellula baltica SH 1]